MKFGLERPVDMLSSANPRLPNYGPSINGDGCMVVTECFLYDLPQEQSVFAPNDLARMLLLAHILLLDTETTIKELGLQHCHMQPMTPDVVL